MNRRTTISPGSSQVPCPMQPAVVLDRFAQDALHKISSGVNRLDAELGKARSVVSTAVEAVVLGGVSEASDEEPLLRSLPGTPAARIIARLARCFDAPAQELGCMALAALASDTSHDWLGADTAVQAARSAASALSTHGGRHSAVALAGCEALTAVLRAAARSSPARPAARDALLSALVAADVAGLICAALEAHTAEDGVQVAGLQALLLLWALTSTTQETAATDAVRTHIASSAAGDAAVSALWTHSAVPGVLAVAAELLGAMLAQQSNTTNLLARGAAQALVAALRGSGGAVVAVRRASCVALLRCAAIEDRAVHTALRYAAVPDALRAVLAVADDAMTRAAAQGALQALSVTPSGGAPSAAPLTAYQPVTPPTQPQQQQPQVSQRTAVADARAADLMARARQDAIRSAMQAQYDAAELLRRQMQDAQELLYGHETEE